MDIPVLSLVEEIPYTRVLSLVEEVFTSKGLLSLVLMSDTTVWYTVWYYCLVLSGEENMCTCVCIRKCVCVVSVSVL